MLEGMTFVGNRISESKQTRSSMSQTIFLYWLRDLSGYDSHLGLGKANVIFKPAKQAPDVSANSGATFTPLKNKQSSFTFKGL